MIQQEWKFPFCPAPEQWLLPWDELQARFSWLSALNNVPQDPIYHAEGNVLIHTGMVAQAMIELAAWRALTEMERALLFAAALLHDVAKPQCTQIDSNGRVSSQGHARKGEKVARQILWTGEELDLPAPFVAREQIAALVRFHGLPLQFLNRAQPERALFEASQRIRLDLVALLAEADVRGRICAEQQELLERVELFRIFAQELHCYQQPRQFVSAHSRFIYFHSEQGSADYAAYDETQFEVVLMCGLPGAGKDTWLRTHLPDWPIISLDEIRKELHIAPEDAQGPVVQLAKERARVLLRRQQPFAWNATNVSKMRRQELIDLFTAYHARVRLVYLDAPLPTLYKRNRERKAAVPEKILLQMVKKFDIPDLTEAQKVEYYPMA